MADSEEEGRAGALMMQMNEAEMPDEESGVLDPVFEAASDEAAMESIGDASHDSSVAEVEEVEEGLVEHHDQGGATGREDTSKETEDKSGQDQDIKSIRDSLFDSSSFAKHPDVASMRDAMFDSSSFAQPGHGNNFGPSSLSPQTESAQQRERSTRHSSRPATGGAEDGVQLAPTESVPRLKTPGTPRTSRPTTRGSGGGGATQDGQAQGAQEVLTPRRQLPMLMHANSSVQLTSGEGGSERQGEGNAPITLRQTVEIEIGEPPPESSLEKYPSPSTGSMIRQSRRGNHARRKGLNLAVMDGKGLSVASVDLRSVSEMMSSISRSSDEPLSEAAILAAAAAADRVRRRKEKQKHEMHQRLQRMTATMAEKKARMDRNHPENSDDDEDSRTEEIQAVKEVIILPHPSSPLLCVGFCHALVSPCSPCSCRGRLDASVVASRWSCSQGHTDTLVASMLTRWYGTLFRRRRR